VAEDEFVSEVKKDFGGGGIAKDKSDLNDKIGNLGRGLQNFYAGTRKAFGIDRPKKVGMDPGEWKKYVASQKGK